MTVLHALILGAVQGLTEFLPISSSGHLVMVPSLLGWDVQSLAFDTVLHLATACALIIYFFKDLLKIIRDRKLTFLVLVGSIPAGVLGFLLEKTIEETFRSVSSVGVFLLAGTLLMLLAEHMSKKTWHVDKIDSIEKIDIKTGFLVGIFQSLALFSGVSRSGSTISGGMLLNLTRDTAARFSFVLSIPIVLGAGVFKLIESYSVLTIDIVLISGFLSSFLVGMFAINFLINYLKNNSLKVFIVYRLVLVIILLFAI